MATNFVEAGNTIDWKNDTGAKVESGALVSVGAIIGVAHDVILPDFTGVLHVTGVFSLPKANGALEQGARVGLSAGKIVAMAEDVESVGVAWQEAEADAESVWVRLGF